MLLFLSASAAHAQNDKKYVPMCVGFYNLENLYDTIDQPDNDDAEFLPASPKRWGSERYGIKQAHMARVISELGTDVHPDGLACVGVSEVENRSVLEDLVKQPTLAPRGYRIVHVDGPDRRGVDCAFLYNPKYFTYIHHRSHRLIDPQDSSFRTRDQLVVTGILDGDTMSCVTVHWPSRRGGEKRSLPKRFLAAELGRHIVDSLLAINPNERIMYMGDLNDDPVDPSVRRIFGATEDKNMATASKFYDPMFDLYQKGIGSLAWGDSWNLFDQIILSPALANGTHGGFRYYGTRVYNKEYLLQSEGNFKGYGFRTWVGDDFIGGYSDHFPVFTILVKESAQP